MNIINIILVAYIHITIHSSESSDEDFENEQQTAVIIFSIGSKNICLFAVLSI